MSFSDDFSKTATNECSWSVLKMRILITGGAGFIGSHLARKFLGNEILVLDESKNYERLYDIKDKINISNMSLSDKNLKPIVVKFDPEIVFHLGGFTLPSRKIDFIKKSMESNISGTVNLLSSLEDSDVKSFVYTSSSEVYGSENESPFKETMPPRPTSPYSVSKLAGEYYTLLYHDTYGFPVSVLRLFNVYGPHQITNRIIPELIVSCLKKEKFKMTKGEQSREFNYIEDTAEALLLSIKTKKSHGEIINIGCGRSMQIKKIVHLIMELMGNSIEIDDNVPYRENEIWDMRSDSSKALKILGWKPKYSIEEGLKKTIEWYKNQWETNKNSICFKGVYY